MPLPPAFQWWDFLEDGGYYTHTIFHHRAHRLVFDDRSLLIYDATGHEHQGAFEIHNLGLSHFEEERHSDVDEVCLKDVVWQDVEDEAVLLDAVDEEEEILPKT